MHPLFEIRLILWYIFDGDSFYIDVQLRTFAQEEI